MKIAEAFVELRTDSRSAVAEARKAGDKVGDEFSKATNRKVASEGKKIGETLAQVFGAAAFTVGMKRTIDAASDLNETISKTKVYFGDASDSVQQYASTAATAMGMSKRAYLDAASGLKGLLDNLGLSSDQSTDWAQRLTALGADLGSFFNTDPADAVAAIGSALRGESEPIRAYNVNINEAAIKTKALEMGLYSGKGAIEQSAKASATLALIVEQTSAAQGDFARTADGVANSQRTAKAEIENSAASMGQTLLPVYNRVLDVVGFLAEGFAALPASVQVGTIAMAGIVAFAGPMSSAVNVVKSLSSAFKNVNPAARGAATGIAVLGAALIALDVINKVTADTQGAADAMNEFIVSTKDASTASLQSATDMANAFFAMASKTEGSRGALDSMLDGLSSGFHEGGVAANVLRRSVDEAFNKLLSMDPTKAVEVAAALDRVAQAAEAGDQQAKNWLKTYGLSRAVIDDFTGRAKNAVGAQDALTASSGVAGNALDGLKGDLKAAGDAADGTATKTENLVDRLLDLKGGFLGAVGSVSDLAATMNGANASTLEQQQALTGAQQKVVDYINQLGGIPEWRKTQIITMLNAGQYNAVIAALQNVSKPIIIPMVMEIRQGTMPTIQQQGYQAAKDFAAAFSGTVSTDPGSYLNTAGTTVGATVGAAAATGAADAAEEAAKKLDSIMANKFETGAISNAEYEAYLRKRLKSLTKFSDDWMAVWREIQRVETDVTDATAEAADRLDSIMANKFASGAISAASYETYLRKRLASLEKFSDEWLAVWNELQQIEEDSVDKQVAAARRLDSIVANKFDTGAISTAGYEAYLRKRLASLEKFSDEWMAVWRELQQVEDDAARKEDDAKDKANRKIQNMYEAGAISKAAYKKHLQDQLADLEKYSDEWMAVWRELQGLEADSQNPVPGPATPSGSYVTGDGVSVTYHAKGGVFSRATMGVFGEAGVEAILPLTRPRDLAGVLSDPRVAGPVAAAMGAGSGGVSIGQLIVGNRTDLTEVERSIDRVAWRVAG